MNVQRRRLMQASLGACTLPAFLLAAPAHAHHGWGSFDTGRPIFLGGEVTRSVWANPHVMIEITVPSGMQVPSDLATRAVPSQRAALDDQAILAATVAPTRRDATWEVELAPLFRMQAWGVEPVKVGQQVMVVGYTFPEERGRPILRAEYLFVGDKAYGLRSNPI